MILHSAQPNLTTDPRPESPAVSSTVVEESVLSSGSTLVEEVRSVAEPDVDLAHDERDQEMAEPVVNGTIESPPHIHHPSPSPSQPFVSSPPLPQPDPELELELESSPLTANEELDDESPLSDLSDSGMESELTEPESASEEEEEDVVIDHMEVDGEERERIRAESEPV